jgi:hypothetical protein
MAITSGFFDSVNGDRTYDADQMSNYFDGLVSDGVYESVGERFLVSSANNGMNINVGSGRAIIQSRWVKNDATEVLTLDPSDVQLNRIDAIVLRLDTSARSIDLVVKKGTAVNGTPTMPEIKRTESVYELYLASVYIAKGATQPTSITDLRPSSYCGWVTGVVQQVDTSDLFEQFNTAYWALYNQFRLYMLQTQKAFDEWFETLTGELKVEAGFVKKENNIIFPIALDAGITKVKVGIDDYEPNSDALLVFFEGVFQSENKDYTLTTVGNEPAINWSHTYTVSAGTHMTFVVFKNIIGKNVLYPSTAETSASGINNYAVGIAEFSEV